MEKIKEHLSNYLKERLDIGDYEINDCFLHHFMDSLDIVEFVFEIEKTYEIDLSDEWVQWEDKTVDDVVQYVYNKLNKIQ